MAHPTHPTDSVALRHDRAKLADELDRLLDDNAALSVADRAQQMALCSDIADLDVRILDRERLENTPAAEVWR